MRLHEPTVEAGSRLTDDGIELTSPMPARFRRSVELGDLVRPGTRLGDLELLGRTVAVVAPAGASGTVVAVAHPEQRIPPVEHGASLVRIDPSATLASSGADPTLATTAAQIGTVFRAPTSGRFYGRPAPDKPAFVSVGDELVLGTTVCLLEVMKTFHRVTYGGGGLPDRARVRAILVADGADVTANEPLLALE